MTGLRSPAAGGRPGEAPAEVELATTRPVSARTISGTRYFLLTFTMSPLVAAVPAAPEWPSRPDRRVSM